MPILRNMVVSGISITAKPVLSSDTEQTYGPFPYRFVYCCRGPFPSFLPHDFLFAIVFSPPLTPCGTLLVFHLLPSKPFPVMDALNRVRRPDWMKLLCLSDVTSILHSDRSPIVCRWTLSWNVIFLTVTSPTCSFLRLSLVLAQKTYVIFLCLLLSDTPVYSTLWLWWTLDTW